MSEHVGSDWADGQGADPNLQPKPARPSPQATESFPQTKLELELSQPKPPSFFLRAVASPAKE